MMRRRSRRRPGDGAPDPDLRLLTVDEAAELRTLVRSALSELGYEPVVNGDHAVLDDGTVLGLDTLVRVCLAERRGRSGWPKAVRAHFGRLLDQTHGASRDSDGTLVVRLMALDQVDTGGLTFTYAPEPIPGLHEVLGVDRPETVETLSDAVVEGRAVPLGALLDEGRENLRALLRRSDAQVDRLTHDGHEFWCAVGDDVYTASYALVLEDALRMWAPNTDMSPGVLFAVPFRHQLAFSVCSDRDAVLAGLTMLPLFAGAGFADGIGPLSPHVYLWLEGTITQVSRHADGGVEVRPGPHLEAILGDSPFGRDAP